MTLKIILQNSTDDTVPYKSMNFLTRLKKIRSILLFIVIMILPAGLYSQGKHQLMINGTGFTLNDEPFEYTGISFFNAIFNEEFNQSPEKRREYIRKFNDYGINVLRIFGQWDIEAGFADAGKGKTLYNEDGSLKPEYLSTLKEIIKDADKEGTVILLCFFTHGSWKDSIRLTDEASEIANANLANELKEFRNLAFQIWNEFDYRALDYYKIIKNIDPDRLVTNSPGWGGRLGSFRENRTFDFLTPHTLRDDDRHWEIAAEEISYLINKYQKPVVDDEPARKGTPEFGGPQSPTLYTDHLIHIYNVWKAGGYVTYQHDMFQMGYGHKTVPINGIPLPGFSPYHDKVFGFLKNKDRYLKNIRSSNTK